MQRSSKTRHLLQGRQCSLPQSFTEFFRQLFPILLLAAQLRIASRAAGLEILLWSIAQDIAVLLLLPCRHVLRLRGVQSFDDCTDIFFLLISVLYAHVIYANVAATASASCWE